MFCLPKFAADELKKKFISGEITPEKLSEMTSEERHSAFKFLGEENAKKTNALFESKLLLKAQQQGIIRWAKQSVGMKPEILRDTLSRVNRLEKVLQPKELDSFLADLAEQRLGFKVTMEEAGSLVELSKVIADKERAIDMSSPQNSPSRLEYGMARELFRRYVAELKLKGETKTFKDYITKPQDTIFKLAGMSKAVLSSLDNSFFGRQGMKVLFNDPGVWSRNFMKSWSDLKNSFLGKDVELAIKSDIFSRDNALNGTYKKMKLAVDIATEEAYPTSLQERIPIIGRFFKASQDAYNGAALRMRADLADKYIKMAKENGIDVTDKVVAESIGKLVNQMTGRGDIGRLAQFGNELNVTLFSIRYLASLFQTFTQPFTLESAFARKQAAISLAKTTASLASILTVANSLWPDSVETNPRSSDFGKIKIGNTRFDVSGGLTPILVLASRIAFRETKNATTGRITKLNSGKYGSKDVMDILDDFALGKLSPAAGLIRDSWIKGVDYKGNVPTVQSAAKNLVTPLPIKTVQELLENPDSAPLWASIILSELGVGVNTFGK